MGPIKSYLHATHIFCIHIICLLINVCHRFWYIHGSWSKCVWQSRQKCTPVVLTIFICILYIEWYVSRWVILYPLEPIKTTPVYSLHIYMLYYVLYTFTHIIGNDLSIGADQNVLDSCAPNALLSILLISGIYVYTIFTHTYIYITGDYISIYVWWLYIHICIYYIYSYIYICITVIKYPYMYVLYLLIHVYIIHRWLYIYMCMYYIYSYTYIYITGDYISIYLYTIFSRTYIISQVIIYPLEPIKMCLTVICIYYVYSYIYIYMTGDYISIYV